MLFRLNWIYTKGTIECVTTLHVQADGDDFNDPNPSPQEVADEVFGNLNLHFRNVLHDSWVLQELSCTTVTDPNNPDQVPVQGTHVSGAPGNASAASEDLPPRICGMIGWRTGLGGRSFRGRSFMPPLEDSAQVTDDLITNNAAYDNAIENYATNVQVANLSGGGGWTTGWTDTWHGKFVVYSPTRHKLGLDPFMAPITGFRWDRKLAYLSSRDT